MARTIAVGEQNYETIIQNDYFYIDKTNFIKEWWENGDSVTLITRPRRFGKTLTMNMTECFFSEKYAGKSSLFEGLAIWEDEKYRKIQGTYPVISLSFANLLADNYEETYYSICRLMEREYRRHIFLVENSSFLQSDRKQFEKILNAEANVSDICMSLNQLSEYLYNYYGKRTILLLDEYDTPMQEAYVFGYWNQMAELMRKLMNATFKTNPYLERGLMTGITRISKESIFSDLNNLEVITTTSKKYAKVFGFTQKEVFQALGEFRLQDSMEEVKRWYDGFHFGDCDNIYNPWSVIKYLDEKEFGPYWANTSSNKLIGKMIQQSSPYVKMMMEDLMMGKTIRTIIDEQIVFDQLVQNETAIWGLLLAGGYLKAVSWQINKRGKKEYTLDISNLEVRGLFQDLFSEWFSICYSPYHHFITAFIANELKSMNTYMNQITLQTISFFDTGNHPSNKSEPERFYHGFVLGLMADLSGRYVITSNRESGFGRYDVMLEPIHSADDAIILEFKVMDAKTENSLQDTAMTAIRQIVDKQYAAGMKAKCARRSIRIYGFAFQGKEVLIAGGYLDQFCSECV